MKLQDLGFTLELQDYIDQNNLDGFELGRVIREHKERYEVRTTDQIYQAEILGNLRYTATDRSDFPAVGDWVAISTFDDDKAIIHTVLPRKSIIERTAVGKYAEKQIIATNIDVGFIVQSVDRDFNMNRIERYMTICYDSQVEPIIILTKVDMVDPSAVEQLSLEINERMIDVPLSCISNIDQTGLDEVQNYIEAGKTYCLLGSSGVGKSSLLNNLVGNEQMATNTISDSTNKGRHVTTHRELIVLESGGIIIDNPGMREVGIADAGNGLEMTFEQLIALAEDCRFSDCTHTSETDCAVIQAVEDGELDEKTYENYLKMEREKEHYESTVAERRKKDKAFGKMVKEGLKNDKRKR